jgi:GT2 family glycosyltransferase
VHKTVNFIIIHYSSLENTLGAIECALKDIYARKHIVVVDNSKGHTTKTIAKTLPTVEFLYPTENVGYVGGNNLVLEKAKADEYYFLINDDVSFAPETTTTLVEALENEATCGAVGPVVLNSDGSIQCTGMKIAPLISHTIVLTDSILRPRNVDGIVGCALLLKGSVVKEVGVLSSEYFMYYEETEYCARIRKAGYTCMVIPNAELTHFGGGKGVEKSPMHEYYMARNQLIYTTRVGSNIEKIGTLAFSIPYALYRITRLLIEKKPARAAKRLVGLLYGIRYFVFFR